MKVVMRRIASSAALLATFVVGGSVLFTWIYRHTRGSLLLAVLTHVGAHLNNPGHAMPQRATPMVIHTVAYVVLATALVLADRGLRTRGPSIGPARSLC